MTENVTIRIGANATQAVREIDRVKKSAAGLRQTFMGFRAGVGMVGGFFGVNLMVEVLKPLKEGFLEVARASDILTFSMDVASQALFDFGKALAGKATEFGVSAVWDAIMGRLGLPPLSTLSGAYALSKQNAASSRLLTGSQYMSPASEQFIVKPDNETKRREEAMLQYVRETTLTLQRMERDLAMQQWTDPW